MNKNICLQLPIDHDQIFPINIYTYEKSLTFKARYSRNDFKHEKLSKIIKFYLIENIFRIN